MSKPEFRIGSHLLPGLIAVALFGIMAAVFLTASFAPAAGFGDASVMEAIGFALLNVEVEGGIPVEGFLVAFVLIAFALDAALDGAIMLARRDEEDGGLTSGLKTDGSGRPDESRAPSEGAERTDGGDDR